MSVTVVSGFGPYARPIYGDRFCDTFDRFWPSDVRLQVYVEEPTPVPRGGERRHDDCEGLRGIVDSWAAIPERCGRRPAGVPATAPRPPAWREREWENDYSFRFDARKFCRQLFYPEQAAKECADGDILVWLDGDVVTKRPVPASLVEFLLGTHDGCYLGRVGTHSEIGFWAVRLSPASRAFLTSLADAYRTGDVFLLREWHSAFVWDWSREQAKGLRFKNLTPNGHGHVWQQSPLAEYMDHEKGARKPGGTRA